MLIFQQHASKNQKQVFEYEKVLQSGWQGTAPSHGGPQKQDPTSRTAGEEGERIYHFEIQLVLLFIERVKRNKTVTVNKIRLYVWALDAEREAGGTKKEVSLWMKCTGWMKSNSPLIPHKCSLRLFKSNFVSHGDFKELNVSVTWKKNVTYDGEASN